MISEQNFSSNFASVWNKITPLADTYWRKENLKLKRELSPIQNEASPKLRGFINELSFETFKEAKKAKIQPRSELIIPIAIGLTEKIGDYIFRITNDQESITKNLDNRTQREVFNLTHNLMLFFPKNDEINFRPKFSGCGIISACEGDLIYEDCLYEVKAGDRKFRVNDIKQLLTYTSLAFSKGQLHFSKVGLFNPRNGYHWERTVDQLCLELSGMRESDVLSNVIAHMTQLAISR
ncbi:MULTISPECIES: hypothetical protein [Pseudomonadaceae]|uniref:hypothetical protein n=1 Tax=Pseudomonadaceae TaxID=135621 RepID=UPI001113008A|nr:MULTISPECIES: hypothetical protein [Pseudomonas]